MGPAIFQTTAQPQGMGLRQEALGDFRLGWAGQNCNFWFDGPCLSSSTRAFCRPAPSSSLVRQQPHIYGEVSLIGEVRALDYNAAEVPGGHCHQSRLLTLLPVTVSGCRTMPLFPPLPQGVESHGPFNTFWILQSLTIHVSAAS